MHRGRVLVSLLFVASVAAPLVSEPAGANHSWGGYHWSSSGAGVALTLGDNVSGTWDTQLATAQSDWDTSTKLSLTRVSGTNTAACSAVTGRIEVCAGAYGENGWLGLASIWFDSTGHISQGTVQVNDTYFLTPTYNNDTARLHVMCQEVGHTFGLDHQHRPGDKSCMNDGWGLFSTDYDQPNQHDVDQLNSIYGHSDTSGGGGGTCKNPRKCSNGQDDEHVFVEPTPNGGTKVTWVTPA